MHKMRGNAAASNVPSFMLLEHGWWFYVAFKLVFGVVVCVPLRFIYIQLHKYIESIAGTCVLAVIITCACRRAEDFRAFSHLVQMRKKCSKHVLLSLFSAQSPWTMYRLIIYLLIQNVVAVYFQSILNVNIKNVSHVDECHTLCHYCSNSHKKIENFTLKYNWKCVWYGNVIFSLLSNADSHVNFRIYLISWFRYAMPSTAFSIEKKKTPTKTRLFLQAQLFFVTIWQFEQKFRKLMFVTRRSLFKVSTCDTYDIWHVLKHTVFHFRKSVFQSIKDFSTAEAFFLPFIFFIIIKFPSFNFRIRPVFNFNAMNRSDFFFARYQNFHWNWYELMMHINISLISWKVCDCESINAIFE